MSDATIKFSFTIDQTNALLNALGGLPFVQAQPLIEMIMLQGSDQAVALMEAQKEAASEDNTQASA